MRRRAVGIVRVSQVGSRDGERFACPAERQERTDAVCERDGLALVAVDEEVDPGGKPLEHSKRQARCQPASTSAGAWRQSRHR
jgi:hypothetical protein